MAFPEVMPLVAEGVEPVEAIKESLRLLVAQTIG